ncbi:helix-turn-helix domain-containing protein [Nesterenkonia aurantiaca]|uniref:AAA ATPase-like protein n=1 Tax=Nesterenkonia aurantiaca TaxID=1436010 RepID=A0A4R7G3H7_9MICC|nr:helix-turn-helix transcriptional regulator [Nesterenkonia aurantiaca]TDS85791.1 AAA ATPase-like protein [Nesterenkonia aurantiaca]
MHPSDPFVGRREEIELIRRAADRAQMGKAQFVVIEGFTGSGKTRLVHQAMEPYSEWNERTILLDESFSRRARSGIRHLLGTGFTGPTELEDLLSSGFDAAQNLQRPYLMSVKNLHLVDEVSAEALWHGLSILQNGPVLVVLSTQGSVRPEVQRLIRLAQASPRGTYIGLQPLPLREVGELLEAYAELPIATSVAAQVLRETDGYPGLVEQVGRWLRRVPAGTRSIDQALAATVRSSDYSGMHRDVMTQMSGLNEHDRRAVALLAAADTALSRPQLESALGAAVDPAALLGTALLSWEELTGRYAVPRRSLSRAVLSGTTEVEQAQLLLTLAGVLEGEESVRHLAEALRRDPSLGGREEVIAALHGYARQAARRQDFHEAFDHVMAAVSMALEDVESLGLLAGLAVRTNRVSALLALEPAMRAMPESTGRSGILALIMLEHSDVDAALQELESVTASPDRGLPVYAEAVIEVNARLYAVSRRRRVAALATRVSATLGEILSRADGLELVGDVWDLGQLQGLEALNQLWVELSAEDPGDAVAMIDHVSAALGQLRGRAGVERFEGAMHAVRGGLHRQVGQMDRAYRDLSVAAAQDGTSSYVMYARSQLALLLFSSAYWEEAQQMADRAAGEGLARGENAVSHVACAVSAVVPAARGEIQKVRQRLNVLHESHFAKGPLATGTIDWVEASLAASQGDFRGVARNLLSMRNDGTAWWAMEPQAVSMLARALHASGWSAMLPALLRSAEGESGVADFQHHLTTPFLRAFVRWGAGAPVEAMNSFLEVLRGYDAAEAIRPTQPPGEGGGFRIFRAMLSIDIATLVTAYPQELTRHRATALELAVWAASVLQSCGADAQLERVNQLMEALRPRLLDKPPRSFGAPAAGGPGTAAVAFGPAGSEEPPAKDPAGARSDIAGSAAPATWPATAASGGGATGATPPVRPRRAEARRVARAPTDPVAPSEPALSLRAEQALRGLSRRERQVSLLVSEGMTNREIAGQLVLSVRTVEYHVANAMTKLEIHSRRDLRGIIGR